MLRRHGMKHTSHLHVNVSAIDLHVGHMLLDRRVDGVGGDLFHLLATADQRHSRIERLYGYVSAMGATIELNVHGFLLGGFRLFLYAILLVAILEVPVEAASF